MQSTNKRSMVYSTRRPKTSLMQLMSHSASNPETSPKPATRKLNSLFERSPPRAAPGIPLSHNSSDVNCAGTQSAAKEQLPSDWGRLRKRTSADSILFIQTTLSSAYGQSCLAAALSQFDNKAHANTRVLAASSRTLPRTLITSSSLACPEELSSLTAFLPSEDNNVRARVPRVVLGFFLFFFVPSSWTMRSTEGIGKHSKIDGLNLFRFGWTDGRTTANVRINLNTAFGQ